MILGAFLPIGVFAQADGYEEDDACIPSETVIRGGDIQSHNFFDDPTDWIKFNACTGRMYTIETSNLGLSADTGLDGLQEIPAETWKIFASRSSPGLARDLDSGTAWTTKGHQTGNDFYGIRFSEPERVARVAIAVRPPYEFPLRLKLAGKVWRGPRVDIPFDSESAYDRLFAQLLNAPRDAWMHIDVETPPLRELQIQVSEDAFKMPWTMAELRLYREGSR